MGETDQRWTIRGIPAEVQKAVVSRAADNRRTVGEFVTAALQAALSAGAADDWQTMPADMVARLADLDRRLSLTENAAGLAKDIAATAMIRAKEIDGLHGADRALLLSLLDRVVALETAVGGHGHADAAVEVEGLTDGGHEAPADMVEGADAPVADPVPGGHDAAPVPVGTADQPDMVEAPPADYASVPEVVEAVEGQADDDASEPETVEGQADTFGQRVRAEREQRGLLQRDLAEAVGTSQSTVTRLESGKKMPKPEICLKLAAFLDIAAPPTP